MNKKLSIILTTLTFMFAGPIIVAAILLSKGGTVTLNEILLNQYQAAIVLTLQVYCIESGIFIFGVFLYGVISGELFKKQ